MRCDSDEAIAQMPLNACVLSMKLVKQKGKPETIWIAAMSDPHSMISIGPRRFKLRKANEEFNLRDDKYYHDFFVTTVPHEKGDIFVFESKPKLNESQRTKGLDFAIEQPKIALALAFEAGANLVHQEWHDQEFCRGDKCPCGNHRLSYTDFKEWYDLIYGESKETNSQT